MPFISARVISVVRADTIAALADAGPDQSVLCAALVQLQADIIGDDIENHTFEWEQTFGTPVTLINPNTLTPSFVNPLVSDLEFTFYLDRNTPFEDSDVVIISRAPQNQVTTVGGGSGMIGFSGISRIGSPANAQNLIQRDARVSGWGFTNPPTARYSPIFEASDLDRVRENLNGDYWLMRDIDLSEYSNWDPIGTEERPFTGDFQGNGFIIDNLSITSTPKSTYNDVYFEGVTQLAKFSATDEDTTYVDDANGTTYTFNNNAKLDDGQVFGTNTTSLYCDGTSGTYARAAAPEVADMESEDFTIECLVWPDDIDQGPIMGIHRSSNDRFWRFWIDTNRVFEVDTYGASAGLIVLQTPNFTMNTGAISGWQHLAFTREGTTLRLFYNGTLYDTNTDLSPGEYLSEDGLPPSGSMQYRHGSAQSSINYYNGYLTNVRITKGTARYTEDFTPPTGLQIDTFKDAGLFSGIGNGANIEQLGVTNANISGISDSVYKGILAGVASGDVTVQDCYTEGTVDSGGDLAGGLIGDTGTDAGSTYENTYSDVTVTGGGTDTGGWAGTFSGTPTYLENYGNTTKTASIVGTGSPGATEVSGLTTAQLTAEANYTDWDFTDTWEIDEGVSPATIQRDDTFIRATGECDDKWMIVWSTPDVTTGQIDSPLYKHKGTIIEEAFGNGWKFPRFIPKNRHGGLMTPDTTHRITTVWDVFHNATDTKPFTTSYINEIQIINEQKFTSKNTSDRFSLYGNDNITGAWGGGGIGITEDFVITISNPRKITMQQEEPLTYGIGGSEGAVTDNVSIGRFVGAQMLPISEDTIAGSAGGATGWDLDLVIVRVNGASIG